MSKGDIDRHMGAPPCHGHPTDLVPPWELQDAPFADPDSLTRAQMRLLRKAEQMTVEGKIIVGDENRRHGMWMNLYRIYDAHKEIEPGRYYPASPPAFRPSGRACAARDRGSVEDDGATARERERPAA